MADTDTHTFLHLEHTMREFTSELRLMKSELDQLTMLLNDLRKDLRNTIQ